MYSLDQLSRGLRRGIETPAVFGRELNRLYYRRLYRRPFNPAGVDLDAADWDNLLVLDACRFDLFRALQDLPGRLESRQSRGSHTVEFLRGNFSGGTFLDTVYVTATPQLHRNRDRLGAEFHAVDNVWRGTGWNDRYGTVLPETMVERAQSAMETYPTKRLLVHFLQPHYPFIRSGEELNGRGIRDGDGDPDVWHRLMEGDLDVSAETVWEAYADNLRAVLPAVRSLLSELPGRTVVTADHGNMFGERAFPVPVREWGHPPGVYTDQLVTVPWLVHDRGPRKEVVAEASSRDRADVDDDAVQSRLQQLGYVT